MDKYIVNLHNDHLLVYSVYEKGLALMSEFHCVEHGKIIVKVFDNITYPRGRIIVELPDGSMVFSHVFDEITCYDSKVRNRLELDPNAEVLLTINVVKKL